MSEIGATWIKGISVTIFVRTQIGTDEGNRPLYEEQPVVVENVLISPSSEQEIIDTLNLTGRKAIYTLAIPKGDSHDWTNIKVHMFGMEFRTIGAAVNGIDTLIPLDWNRKVRCEIINE